MFFRALLIAFLLVQGQQRELERLGECRPLGQVIASGVVQQTSDGSDWYYVGEGLTLTAPPRGATIMHLRTFAANGKRYKIIAVEDTDAR